MSTLPDDVLWHIFWLNCDMIATRQDTSASSVTLGLINYSHVCFKWRLLIVASSSLWGQVIDLDWLLWHPRSMDMVVGRIRTSPVFVAGSESRISSNRSNISNAVSFVEEYWPRIRHLDFTFTSINAFTFERDRIWAILQKPAPFLQTFVFRLPETQLLGHQLVDTHLPQDAILFDDHAPLLRIFLAPQVTFKPKAPWLSGLRILCLTGPILLRDLLLMLRDMPNLEVLGSASQLLVDHADTHALPHVKLSSLEEIDFNSTTDKIGTYVELFKHVTTTSRPNSSFNIITDERELSEDEILQAVVQVLLAFCDFCEIGKAKQICLGLKDDGNFEFKAIFASRKLSHFRVQLRGYIPLNSHWTRPLLAPLLFPAFRNLRNLSLVIGSSARLLPAHQEIADFIQQFESITTLRISPSSTKFLMKMPMNVISSAFPLLRTIKFTSIPKQQDVVSMNAFLGSLLATGHPLRKVLIPLTKGERASSVSIDDFNPFGLDIVFTETQKHD